MAAKVLLGVVALAAIVGSPIAYNHLSSSSGETQKEEETPKNEEANVAQSSSEPQQPASSGPIARAPEIQADRQDTNKEVSLPENVPAEREEVLERAGDVYRDQDSLQADAHETPKNDECELGETQSWDELNPLDKRMHCIRGKVQELRESR